MKKVRGSITIYCCIVLVAVLLLLSVVSEMARMHMVQAQVKGFSYLAVDSVLAGYGKQIYEDYGILLAWEKEPANVQIEKYLQANINMADLEGKGVNLLGTGLEDVTVQKIAYTTEHGGEKFTEQIVSYMKYAGALEAAEGLVHWFKQYQRSSEDHEREQQDVAYIVEETADDLQEFAERLQDAILQAKDTEKYSERLAVVSQKMEKIKDSMASGKTAKKVKKFLKEYRGLMTELDRKASDVDSAMDLMEQYERKKAQFLGGNGYTSGVGDYIEDNLKSLKNIRMTINEIKGLNVSDFSVLDLKNMEIVEDAVSKAAIVEHGLQSLVVKEPTKEDKQNQSIYESAKKLLENGILSLVIEEVSKVSNATISDSNLPTRLKNKNSETGIMKQMKNKAFLALYAQKKFGNYFAAKKNTALQYEMEYILQGKHSDRENLTGTIEKLVVARNLMDVAYLVTDQEKMSEMSSVALSITSAFGLPFLEPVVKAVLVEAWSLAEAVNDVKILMHKKKLSLTKNRNNWRTSLQHLLSGKGVSEGDKKGLTYVQYCQMLMMLQSGYDTAYRMMDLIQVNIQKRYHKDFLMEQCFQGLEVTIQFETKPLFTAMPWSIGVAQGKNGTYTYSITCAGKY